MHAPLKHLYSPLFSGAVKSRRHKETFYDPARAYRVMDTYTKHGWNFPTCEEEPPIPYSSIRGSPTFYILSSMSQGSQVGTLALAKNDG